MKNSLKIILALISLGILLTACQNFDQPNLIGPESETNKNTIGFDDNYNTLDNIKLKDNTESKRIAQGSQKKVMRNYIELKYDSTLNAYKGGAIHMQTGNGSIFQIKDKSTVPPPNHEYGAPVKVAMQIVHDIQNNEMIFTFGPSGTQFSPSARIKLDYSLLSAEGATAPNLYYIGKGGQYQLQLPDHIDCKKNFMIISVDHFSRYAVAYGR